MSKKKESVNNIIKNALAEQVEEMKKSLKESVSVKDKKSGIKKLKEEFELFWAQKKNKYKMYGNISEAVFSHFLAYGFTSPDKFEEGLKHFGLE